MQKFYKYLFLILGGFSLIAFIDTLFDKPDEIYSIFRFEVSKTSYLIYKLTLATILIFAGIKTKVKN